MPSRMCINPIHNKKGLLNRSDNQTTEERQELLDDYFNKTLTFFLVPTLLTREVSLSLFCMFLVGK